MPAALFCEHCGAALAGQEYMCPVCGQVQPTLTASPAVVLKAGFVLEKRYRILKQIGAGGFGLVYKAWDSRERAVVAIKQITLATLSARDMIEVTASYNREITILPRLAYAGLPVVYDHFTDPGHWYIVMEYIEGQTLEEKLATLPEGRLSIEEVLRIGVALCDILGYLHAQNQPVIFRDVKPANIMVTSEHQLYLIDFGIARYYQSELSKDTGPLGSPGYAAPEQYGKAQSTPQTDIYGLGATLQTLLTGKDPLELRADGIPADCVIPVELQGLLDTMMAREPHQRPARMSDVSRRLQYFLDEHYSAQKPAKALTWLVGLWVALAFLIGSFIFFSPTLSGIILLIELCLLVFQVYRICQKEYAFTHRKFRLIINVFLMALFSAKIRPALSSGLTVEEARRLLKNALAKAFWNAAMPCFLILWGPGVHISFDVSAYMSHLPLVITIVMYASIYIAGLVLIGKGNLPFLKQVQPWPGASQKQSQPVQKMTMLQRIYKKP